MFTTFFILVMVVAGVTILWRTLKDDHPKLKTFVQNLPVVGEALMCGICIAYWFSLPVALVMDIFPMWQAQTSVDPIALFFVEWIALGTGVLLLRSAIIVLLEAGAILKHRHHSSHQ